MNKLALYLNKNRDKYIIKKYPKNSIVLYENDYFSLIIFVIKGKLVAETNQYDNPLIFNYFKENDFIGNNLIFSSKKILKGNIICKSECTLLFLRRSEFIEILCNSQIFLEEYLTYCSKIILNEKTIIKCLKISNIKERLLFFIGENNGSVYYENISSLAKNLSTTRENLSRIISSLEQQNKIVKEKHFIRFKH